MYSLLILLISIINYILYYNPSNKLNILISAIY